MKWKVLEVSNIKTFVVGFGEKIKILMDVILVQLENDVKL